MEGNPVVKNDFERINKLITDNFPNSLKKMRDLGVSTITMYEFDNTTQSITYRDDKSIMTLYPKRIENTFECQKIDKDAFKESFESKTKLILEEI